MTTWMDAGARLAQAGLVLALLCAASGTARAQGYEPSGELSTAQPVEVSAEAYEAPPRPPGPFDQGRFRLGEGLGWADGVGTDWLISSTTTSTSRPTRSTRS